MRTCEYCQQKVVQRIEDRAVIQFLELDECECIDAACGHRLSSERDDMPPCPVCDRCERCCPCVCERCGKPLQSFDDCLNCVAEPSAWSSPRRACTIRTMLPYKPFIGDHLKTGEMDIIDDYAEAQEPESQALNLEHTLDLWWDIVILH